MGLFRVFMLQSYKWIGLGWDGLGSLCGAIVWAPLCGANKLAKPNILVELNDSKKNYFQPVSQSLINFHAELDNSKKKYFGPFFVGIPYNTKQKLLIFSFFFFHTYMSALGLLLSVSASQWGGARLFPKKSIRRCQIDRLRDCYKWAIDKIRGPIAKNEFLGQNPAWWPENAPPSGRTATKNRSEGAKSKISSRVTNGPLTKSGVQ